MKRGRQSANLFWYFKNIFLKNVCFLIRSWRLNNKSQLTFFFITSFYLKGADSGVFKILGDSLRKNPDHIIPTSTTEQLNKIVKSKCCSIVTVFWFFHSAFLDLNNTQWTIFFNFLGRDFGWNLHLQPNESKRRTVSCHFLSTDGFLQLFFLHYR